MSSDPSISVVNFDLRADYSYEEFVEKVKSGTNKFVDEEREKYEDTVNPPEIEMVEKGSAVSNVPHRAFDVDTSGIESKKSTVIRVKSVREYTKGYTRGRDRDIIEIPILPFNEPYDSLEIHKVESMGRNITKDCEDLIDNIYGELRAYR
ncbi:MAG: hypothetical protein SVV03_00030 [Candidatus Nanohaloarchaea archaeon]|nr:hypothetical protein [Candidatus Nanohaloarchaea archaeon]